MLEFQLRRLRLATRSSRCHDSAGCITAIHSRPNTSGFELASFAVRRAARSTRGSYNSDGAHDSARWEYVEDHAI